MNAQTTEQQKEKRDILFNLRLTPTERKMFSDVAAQERRSITNLIICAVIDRATARRS